MSLINFTIIIPVKEINNYVKETVGKIKEFDNLEWEVLILPNDLNFNPWSEDKRVRIHSTGRLGPADKRDIGARLAKGRYLIFFDDDSYPSSDYLSVATKYFEENNVAAIGGPGVTPKSDSFWQRVSGAVFLSRFTGGAPDRYIPLGKSYQVDDWPSVNFIIKAEVFKDVGGFDCEYWPGEDTRLCLKLKKKGYAINYVPSLIVWHHRRGDLLSHLRQVGAYGLHRGFFAKKYPETSLRLKYFLPSIFFIFLLVSLPALISGNILLEYIINASLMIYIFLIVFGMLQIAYYEKLAIAICALPYIFLTHIVYGHQFLFGFLFKKTLKSRLR